MNLDRIAANVQEIRQRIADAAIRSGRAADDVQLLAVTKYVDVHVAAMLLDAGCRDLGESRPQDVWHKAGALAGRDVRWHLVGPLQRNKIRRTLPLVHCIQSIDNWRTLAALDRVAVELDLRPRVLIEINISGDSSKHGLPPGEAAALLQEAAQIERVEIRGLMGMASLEGGPDVARRNFSDLRKLREALRGECPPNVRLDELSMGMSGDFEIAIEEGATIVRVGSLLVDGLELP